MAFVFNLETLIIGVIIGIVIALVLAAIMKRFRKANPKGASFELIRGEIKQGHDGLVQASKSMRKLNEVFAGLEKK